MGYKLIQTALGIESTYLDLHVSIAVDQDEKEPMPENMAAASWAFFPVRSRGLGNELHLSNNTTRKQSAQL